MSGSSNHPPSTNGSPRPTRRALLTGVAALAALALPVGLVSTATSDPASAQGAASPRSDERVDHGSVADLFAPHDPPVQALAVSTTPAEIEPAPAPAPAPVARRAPAPAPAPPPPPPPPPTRASGDPNDPASWDRLAQCESGGNWAINTGNGYYGGLQFSLSSWQAVGGTGYPHEHPRETQIEMGRRLYNQGGWAHWPGCTRSFGWR